MSINNHAIKCSLAPCALQRRASFLAPSGVPYSRSLSTTMGPREMHVDVAVAASVIIRLIAVTVPVRNAIGISISPHIVLEAATVAAILVGVIQGIVTTTSHNSAAPVTITPTAIAISIHPPTHLPPTITIPPIVNGIVMAATIRITAMFMRHPTFRPGGWPPPRPLLPLVAVANGEVMWLSPPRGGGVSGRGITDELARSATTPFATPSVLPIKDDATSDPAPLPMPSPPGLVGANNILLDGDGPSSLLIRMVMTVISHSISASGRGPTSGGPQGAHRPQSRSSPLSTVTVVEAAFHSARCPLSMADALAFTVVPRPAPAGLLSALPCSQPEHVRQRGCRAGGALRVARGFRNVYAVAFTLPPNGVSCTHFVAGTIVDAAARFLIISRPRRIACHENDSDDERPNSLCPAASSSPASNTVTSRALPRASP